MILPNYSNSIANMMGTLGQAMSGVTQCAPSPHLDALTIRSARNIVLILVDGLPPFYADGLLLPMDGTMVLDLLDSGCF